MNAFVHYLIIAFLTACVTDFTDSTDGVYMFLPFSDSESDPPSCPPNEFYKPCTGNCSDCIQRGNCIITKCLSGCDCAPRFFRLTPGGPCEPVANCPKPECGENEVFRECGPVCEKCTTYKCQIISCDHTCYCTKGYLRNKEGICIPQEECPKRTRCGRTEEWADTGLINEFCLYSEDENYRNETQDAPQCYCKEGHKRNNLGHCINETRCHSTECYGIEVHNNCVPKCNSTCRNYGDPDCFEDDNCYEGCFCPPGYVMNDFRTCIPIEDCSPDTMHVLVREESETPEEDGSSDEDSLTTPATIETTDTMNATETMGNGDTSCTDSNNSQTESSSESEDLSKVETTPVSSNTEVDDLSNKTESAANEPGEGDSNDKSESSDEPGVDNSNDKSELSDESCADANDKSELSAEPGEDDSNYKRESSDEPGTGYSNDKSETSSESSAAGSNDKNGSLAESTADANDKSESSDESSVNYSNDKSELPAEPGEDGSNYKTESSDEPGTDYSNDKSETSSESATDGLNDKNEPSEEPCADNSSDESKSSDEAGEDGLNDKYVSPDESSADDSNDKRESLDERGVAEAAYASAQSSSRDEYDFDNDAI